jgi:hypothetical protein
LALTPPKGKDTLNVSVYSHYWFINQTGLRVLYRTEDEYDPDYEEADPGALARGEGPAGTADEYPDKLVAGQAEVLEATWYDMALDLHEWYQHDETTTREMCKPLLFSPYR